jgi:hypothetical protein
MLLCNTANSPVQEMPPLRRSVSFEALKLAFALLLAPEPTTKADDTLLQWGAK